MMTWLLKILFFLNQSRKNLAFKNSTILVLGVVSAFCAFLLSPKPAFAEVILEQPLANESFLVSSASSNVSSYATSTTTLVDKIRLTFWLNSGHPECEDTKFNLTVLTPAGTFYSNNLIQSPIAPIISTFEFTGDGLTLAGLTEDTPWAGSMFLQAWEDIGACNTPAWNTKFSIKGIDSNWYFEVADSGGFGEYPIGLALGNSNFGIAVDYPKQHSDGSFHIPTDATSTASFIYTYQSPFTPDPSDTFLHLKSCTTFGQTCNTVITSSTALLLDPLGLKKFTSQIAALGNTAKRFYMASVGSLSRNASSTIYFTMKGDDSAEHFTPSETVSLPWWLAEVVNFLIPTSEQASAWFDNAKTSLNEKFSNRIPFSYFVEVAEAYGAADLPASESGLMIDLPDATGGTYEVNFLPINDTTQGILDFAFPIFRILLWFAFGFNCYLVGIKLFR